MSSTPFLITMPKYVAIPNQKGIPISKANSVIDDDQPCVKKRRLDHLTWEEKLQRK